MLVRAFLRVLVILHGGHRRGGISRCLLIRCLCRRCLFRRCLGSRLGASLGNIAGILIGNFIGILVGNFIGNIAQHGAQLPEFRGDVVTAARHIGGVSTCLGADGVPAFGGLGDDLLRVRVRLVDDSVRGASGVGRHRARLLVGFTRDDLGPLPRGLFLTLGGLHPLLSLRAQRVGLGSSGVPALSGLAGSVGTELSALLLGLGAHLLDLLVGRGPEFGDLGLGGLPDTFGVALGVVDDAVSPALDLGLGGLGARRRVIDRVLGLTGGRLARGLGVPVGRGARLFGIRLGGSPALVGIGLRLLH